MGHNSKQNKISTSNVLCACNWEVIDVAMSGAYDALPARQRTGSTREKCADPGV